jgi:hypothetical protein
LEIPTFSDVEVGLHGLEATPSLEVGLLSPPLVYIPIEGVKDVDFTPPPFAGVNSIENCESLYFIVVSSPFGHSPL